MPPERFGGPWTTGSDPDRTRGLLLLTYFGVCLVSAAFAALVWRASRAGALLALAWPPVAAFWYGFALPFPVGLGLVRVGLLTSAFRRASGP